MNSYYFYVYYFMIIPTFAMKGNSLNILTFIQKVLK